jgi:hypothetical protein
MGISSIELINCRIRKDQITCSGLEQQLYSQLDGVSLFQGPKFYFKLDESEEDLKVYPMEGNSQYWSKQENVIKLCNPWLYPFVREINFKTLTTLESIDGLHYLPCLEEAHLEHLPQLTHISGRTWPTKIRSIWISDYPMLKEIPPWDTLQYGRDLRYSSQLVLQECGAMEAFLVEDNFKTWLSQKNDTTHEFHLAILGCRFWSMEDLERWMSNSKFRSPLFVATLRGLLWKLVVEVIIFI